MKNKMALVVAVLLGLVSLAGVNKYVKDKENELRGDVNEVDVLVAKDDLDKGTELTDDTVKTGKVPQRYLLREMVKDTTGDRKAYIGKILLEPVKKDQYLLTSYFNLGDIRDSLERRISPGNRAVTVRVDDTSGFAGLLHPGAYVDVLGTFDVEVKLLLGTQVAEQETVTKTLTVLRQKPVLAVGKQLGTTGIAEEASSPTSGESESTTVTLEVSPQEAQELIYAQNKGKISLVLRQTGDKADNPVTPVDMEYLLKKAGMK